MLSREGKQTDRGAVGAEFIGYNRRRREALLLQEFPHQPNCRPSVPAGLNQEIQDFALTVHGTPEIELPPSNYDDHLVQVPAFGRSWPPTLNPPRIGPTEFQDPSSNCLIRDVETTLGKQVLNVPIAQRETAIEPDGMLDDDRWKAVTTVGYLAHPETLKHRPCRSHAVNVTMPWEGVLKPVVVRYKGRKVRLYFRGDAAFAAPEMYEYLEAEGFLYAIRLPKNQVLQESVAHLLTRPVGRPPNHVLRFYASFSYRAGSWDKKRRVVAKVEWHPGELVPRVGFIVTNLSRSAERVTWFYNQRGKAEQYIKEGKNAIKWTRLSCRKFRDNAVRLQLHALAYNLANFMRTLALPKEVEHWSLTTLREKLVKIGAKVVRHGRYVTFQLAEVAVPKDLFRKILRLIDDLRPRPAPA